MTLKELCEKYDIKYQSNHADKIRKQLSKYCEFKQQGRDYTIIRELTDVEKLAFNSKFSDYITDLLIKQLSLSKTTVFTYTELFENLGLVNEFYKKARSNIYSHKPYYETPKFIYDITDYELNNGDTEYHIIENNLYKFFISSSKILKEIIRNSLNSMQKRRLLYWKPTYRVYKKLDNGSVISYNCDKELAGKILDWENEALSYLGYKTKWFGKDTKAKNYLNQYVNQHLNQYGYNYYTDAVDLTLATESIKREAHKIDCQYILNNNIQTKLLESKEMDNIIKTLNKQFIKEYVDISKIM